MDSTTLSFGKYKNMKISEVLHLDQQYCKWLYKQPMLMEKFPDTRSFLESQFKNKDLSYQMNWGRYKGEGIKTIFDTDPKYFEWLKSNEYVSDHCPKLKEAIDKLA